MPRSAILIDRDGTIIEDTHYPRDPKQVVFVPKAAEGLRLMQEKGYLLFVVSNQSGVGRGIIKDTDFRAVHERVCELLKEERIEIAEFAFCFHHPDDDCLCRKPKTGLVTNQFQGEMIAWAESFGVGDKQCDLQLAENVGAQPCLVLSGKGQTTLQELKVNGADAHYATYQDLLQMAEMLPDLKHK